MKHSHASPVSSEKSDETVPSVPSKATPLSRPDAGVSARWTAMVNQLRAPILHGIQDITRVSANHPKRTIFAVVFISLALFVTGVCTNFTVEVDGDILWTPFGSHPVEQMQWIQDESGFPREARNLVLIFHQEGRTDTLLGLSQMRQVFEAVDLIRNLDDYPRICALWEETKDCSIYGVTKFWNQSVDVLNAAATTDDEVIAQLSNLTFPDDQTPVSQYNIYGNPQRDTNGRLTSIQMYVVSIRLPSLADEEDTTVEDFEEKALDVILKLQETWAAAVRNTNDPTQLHIEVLAERSFDDEFGRAILSDIPLVAVVFVIMGIFTSGIFFKRDRVRSRSLFGFTAVLSILLGIMAGYGLMFLCGVPFTSMVQILPFVYFGVGLDDAFIITGAYFRLDRRLDPVERVRITMDEIGFSIFLTSLTSAVAMALGCTTTIPAVYWLCLYAVPTTFILLLFQLTFFIACLILDERRVAANHRDCWRCCQGSKSDASIEENRVENAVDQWMGWYAEKLMVPWVKILVLLSFTAITVACAISTSQLRQAFSFLDVLPGDSYIAPFFRARVDYNARDSIDALAFFRDVDQSDVLVQDQMEAYINQLVSIDAILYQPQFFWLRDFRSFVQNNSDSMVGSLEFTSQLDAFLADPVFSKLYQDQIVRDPQTSAIITSRCEVKIDKWIKRM